MCFFEKTLEQAIPKNKSEFALQPNRGEFSMRFTRAVKASFHYITNPMEEIRQVRSDKMQSLDLFWSKLNCSKYARIFINPEKSMPHPHCCS